MPRKAILSILLCLTGLTGASLAGTQKRVVLGVTTDAIEIKGATETQTYQVSNELLANTIPNYSGTGGLNGKITQVKKGCKILIEYEKQDGRLVCIALETRK